MLQLKDKRKNPSVDTKGHHGQEDIERESERASPALFAHEGAAPTQPSFSDLPTEGSPSLLAEETNNNAHGHVEEAKLSRQSRQSRQPSAIALASIEGNVADHSVHYTTKPIGDDAAFDSLRGRSPDLVDGRGEGWSWRNEGDQDEGAEGMEREEKKSERELTREHGMNRSTQPPSYQDFMESPLAKTSSVCDEDEEHHIESQQLQCSETLESTQGDAQATGQPPPPLTATPGAVSHGHSVVDNWVIAEKESVKGLRCQSGRGQAAVIPQAATAAVERLSCGAALSAESAEGQGAMGPPPPIITRNSTVPRRELSPVMQAASLSTDTPVEVYNMPTQAMEGSPPEALVHPVLGAAAQLNMFSLPQRYIYICTCFPLLEEASNNDFENEREKDNKNPFYSFTPSESSYISATFFPPTPIHQVKVDHPQQHSRPWHTALDPVPVFADHFLPTINR